MTRESFKKIVVNAIKGNKDVEFFMFDDYAINLWVRNYPEMCTIIFYDDTARFGDNFTYLCRSECSPVVKRLISAIIESI